jgi:hypothetical protein
MHFGWQDLLVAVPVAAAAGYLVRRGWLLMRGRSRGGCGSACGGCESGKKSEPSSVVQLELPAGKQSQQ